MGSQEERDEKKREGQRLSEKLMFYTMSVDKITKSTNPRFELTPCRLNSTRTTWRCNISNRQKLK
jgi:hypothetical protein